MVPGSQKGLSSGRLWMLLLQAAPWSKVDGAGHPSSPSCAAQHRSSNAAGRASQVKGRALGAGCVRLGVTAGLSKAQSSVRLSEHVLPVLLTWQQVSLAELPPLLLSRCYWLASAAAQHDKVTRAASKLLRVQDAPLYRALKVSLKWW